MCVCCEMITTIKLINPAVTSHSYLFFFLVRMPKIYSLNKFQVLHTVLLTVVTMLYIRFPELIHLVTEIMYTAQSLATTILLCFDEFDSFFLDLTWE